MTTHASHKSRFLAIAAMILVIAMSSTAALPASNQLNLAASNPAQTVAVAQKSKAPPAPAEEPLYLGEDWEEQLRGKKAPQKDGKKKDRDAKPSQAASQPNSEWSLVLGTFTEENHEAAAAEMIANLPRIAPSVRGARVHTTPKGSMVVYGRYVGRDDPNAKADQERLKAITFNNHPVFNRVLLTRLDLRWQRELHPHDLFNARKEHPKVNPLYTLDVAIWMTNTDPKEGPVLTYEEVRAKAEAYAAELRTRKEEAYFYHDDENQWSVVTIGLFDRRAINDESGLFNDDVMRVVKRFPKRLVNGEELIVLTNAKRVQDGGRPQEPKLVLVPGM